MSPGRVVCSSEGWIVVSLVPGCVSVPSEGETKREEGGGEKKHRGNKRKGFRYSGRARRARMCAFRHC